MSKLMLSCSVLVLWLVGAPAVQAQADSSLLTLERIFNSAEFAPQFPGSTRWMVDGATYTKLQRAAGGGQNIVRVNAATGDSSVLVPASRFTPAGATQPLRVENYTWSPDGAWLLLFTNSARVWRSNTRGDY